MADRKRWMRWALYAVQLLLLFVLQETPGLLPPVMGAKPMLILAAALTESPWAQAMGIIATALASVNVFGGFLVTRRMLEMFKKKGAKNTPKEGQS